MEQERGRTREGSSHLWWDSSFQALSRPDHSPWGWQGSWRTNVMPQVRRRRPPSWRTWPHRCASCYSTACQVLRVLAGCSSHLKELIACPISRWLGAMWTILDNEIPQPACLGSFFPSFSCDTLCSNNVLPVLPTNLALTSVHCPYQPTSHVVSMHLE